jgi:hypothetical protein
MEPPRLILPQGGRDAEKPLETNEPGDTTIYRADYRSWWRLPPPLPPRRPPVALLVFAVVLLATVLFAVGGDRPV